MIHDYLISLAPRGILMIPVCLVSFNLWRWLPFEPVASYAWGCAFVALALAFFRLAPDEAVTIGMLLTLAATAAALGGAETTSRVFCGGILVLLALSSWDSAASPRDKALAFGIMTEFASWLLGNSARGTFGPDVAHSAIGQAYGPYAQPFQWLAIACGYAVAWYCVIKPKV